MEEIRIRRLSVENHSPRLAERRLNYPDRLKARHVLVRGNCDLESFRRPAVAIVGTRKPTPYGIRFVRELMPHLRSLNCTVLSGGALGIDGEVHRAALRCGVPTQSWLVGPLLSPNPRCHHPLFEAIVRSPGGALLVPENLEPSAVRPVYRADWIERNQWLVAAADLLIVVEARVPSGTWSSAQAAQAFYMSIYLLPGPFFSPQSSELNRMISEGWGHPVTDIKELTKSIVVELGTTFYNKERGPANCPGPEGESTDREPDLDLNLLGELRQILNIHKGLSLESLWDLTLRQQVSQEVVQKHLAWMLVKGEIQRSGDRFERRG